MQTIPWQLPAQERARLFPLMQHPASSTFFQAYLAGSFGTAWIPADQKNALSVTSALLYCGDFCFFLGKPAPDLAVFLPPSPDKTLFILIPSSPAWEALLADSWNTKARTFTRYQMGLPENGFSLSHLTACQNLPAGYQLQKIDEALYHCILTLPWAMDLCANFPTWEDYARLGLGYVALYQGQIAAGASSYMPHSSAVEIEIDTHPKHRRRHLATACGAALITEALSQGKIPSWDAHTLISASLAQKLGYRLLTPYTAYEVRITIPEQSPEALQ